MILFFLCSLCLGFEGPSWPDIPEAGHIEYVESISGFKDYNKNESLWYDIVKA